jgi:hypothetical protein
MTTTGKVDILIENLKTALNCPQKTIAKLIDVPEYSQIDQLSDLFRKKLSQLYDIVLRFACMGLKYEVIFEILEAHVYEDYLGRLDSVSSAISQQKYSGDTLKEIADRAYNRNQESQQEKFETLELKQADF